MQSRRGLHRSSYCMSAAVVYLLVVALGTAHAAQIRLCSRPSIPATAAAAAAAPASSSCRFGEECVNERCVGMFSFRRCTPGSTVPQLQCPSMYECIDGACVLTVDGSTGIKPKTCSPPGTDATDECAPQGRCKADIGVCIDNSTNEYIPELSSYFSAKELTAPAQSDCDVMRDVLMSTGGRWWAQSNTGGANYTAVTVSDTVGAACCQITPHVSCESGRIAVLKLADRNLSGTLPPSLARLDKLTTLEIGGASNSRLSVPDALNVSSWAALQSLDLSNLPLGKLPQWVLTLASNMSLSVLYAGNMSLSLPLTMSFLSEFSILDLHGNTGVTGFLESWSASGPEVNISGTHACLSPFGMYIPAPQATAALSGSSMFSDPAMVCSVGEVLHAYRWVLLPMVGIVVLALLLLAVRPLLAAGAARARAHVVVSSLSEKPAEASRRDVSFWQDLTAVQASLVILSLLMVYAEVLFFVCLMQVPTSEDAETTGGRTADTTITSLIKVLMLISALAARLFNIYYTRRLYPLFLRVFAVIDISHFIIFFYARASRDSPHKYYTPPHLRNLSNLQLFLKDGMQCALTGWTLVVLRWSIGAWLLLALCIVSLCKEIALRLLWRLKQTDLSATDSYGDA
ncbi:hypothetical protein RI367_008281 [Sorochytrium milnesiophthora]